MSILIGASLVAAFIAGVAALFAPCCITVLLPSYFGSIFRSRKKVFFMTFIFFLGILTVFLPLGLGMSALGQIFSRYHRDIFWIAGGFFLVLGSILLSGRKFSIPWKIHPTFEKTNAFSVYVLGIFSGIATTCCAPVLAGVFALSVLPGSFFWGGLYTLAYVVGMVAPLFVIAAFLDKTHLTQKMLKASIETSLPWGKVTIPDIVSGVTFLVMGVVTLVAAMRNTVGVHSSYQVSVNIYLAKLQESVQGLVGAVPGLVWAFLLLAIVAVIVRVAVKQFRNESLEVKEQKSNSKSCHEK